MFYLVESYFLVFLKGFVLLLNDRWICAISHVNVMPVNIAYYNVAVCLVVVSFSPKW